MGNLTITVDDATLKRARIRALERGESVNTYLAEMLKRYAGDYDQAAIFEELGRAADTLRAGRDDSGRTWTRDDLYDV
jgi:hypothetical protein